MFFYMCDYTSCGDGNVNTIIFISCKAITVSFIFAHAEYSVFVDKIYQC